jgi:hypothetical protein
MDIRPLSESAASLCIDGADSLREGGIVTKKPSKSQTARDNISSLANIGLAAMEYEAARRRAYVALHAIRKARNRDADEDDDDNRDVEIGEYTLSARERKNAHERMLRMIARYRKWLAEVNGERA